MGNEFESNVGILKLAMRDKMSNTFLKLINIYAFGGGQSHVNKN